MASQTKKITLDTAALFTGRAVGLLLGIVRLNYLATYLGVANFGILNFAAYFTALFQSLFDLGISQLLTREIARDLPHSNHLLGTAVVLKVFIAVASSILVGAVSIVSHFDHVTNYAILLTTAALAINSIASAFLSAFQAQRKMVLVSVASMVNDALLSAAIILLIPHFPNVTTALLLTGGAAAVGLMILLVFYIRVAGMPHFRIDRPAWQLLVREGSPMAVSALGISLYTFIGPTVLRYTRGETEVGMYSAGYKIISIMTLIPATVTQVIYPIFADFSKSAPAKIEKALQDSLRVMAELSIPLAVGGAILAPQIIAFLYPASFAAAADVLRIIIIGSAVGYLAQILYIFLLALNRQAACMWNLLAVAGAVILANLFIVPQAGFRGVAFVFMCTDIVLFLSLLVLAGRTRHSVRIPPEIGKIILSAATMGGALLLLRDWPLIPVVLIGGSVYVAMLFAFRVFGDQETQIVTKLLRR
jgi:O-antigen/teichoic acid export membrane protein